MRQLTDTELLDGLERATETGACPALIYDDNGHWAVAEEGMQDVPPGDAPGDVATTFFIPARQWCNSAREALQRYVRQANVITPCPTCGAHGCACVCSLHRGNR